MRIMVYDPEGTKYRVLLNGEDISGRCYGADEELGEAYCYDLKDGQFYALPSNDPGKKELARLTLRGEVKLIRIERGKDENPG